jgi:hypothetical protein
MKAEEASSKEEGDARMGEQEKGLLLQQNLSQVSEALISGGSNANLRSKQASGNVQTTRSTKRA